MCKVTQFGIIYYQVLRDDRKAKSVYFAYNSLLKANQKVLKKIYKLELSNRSLYIKRNCLYMTKYS